MNKLLICLISLLFSTVVHSQTNYKEIIKNDTLMAYGKSHYKILKALAHYYDLQLILGYPKKVYKNEVITAVNFPLKQRDELLKALTYQMKIGHIVKGNNLLVGWVGNATN